jgi:threonine dehydratase
MAAEQGLTMIHPFDDIQLIGGQGTLGLEIVEDLPDVDAVVVPIGGGGLISGVSMAVKSFRPDAKVFGVESSDGPAMKASIDAGHLVTLDTIDTVIDGLRVKRVGETTFQVVQQFVDEIVTLPDAQIFEAVLWVMGRCKLVIEGAAAATVGALQHGLVDLPAGSKVACVLSGGNIDVDRWKGEPFN